MPFQKSPVPSHWKCQEAISWRAQRTEPGSGNRRPANVFKKCRPQTIPLLQALEGASTASQRPCHSTGWALGVLLPCPGSADTPTSKCLHWVLLYGWAYIKVLPSLKQLSELICQFYLVVFHRSPSPKILKSRSPSSLHPHPQTLSFALWISGKILLCN